MMAPGRWAVNCFELKGRIGPGGDATSSGNKIAWVVARWRRTSGVRRKRVFVFKKVFGTLLMPLPLGLTLAWIGVALLGWGRWRRLARGVIASALLLLTLVSLAPVSAWMADPLERAYPAFPGDSVDAVVVLGSGHGTDPRLPPTSLLSSSALYRLVEGLRIAQAQPWARLVLSGYGGADPRANAEVYRGGPRAADRPAGTSLRARDLRHPHAAGGRTLPT